MRRFGLIGVSALSLALAATASAQDRYMHRAKPVIPATTAAGDPNLPIENALRWGYSQGYTEYPSGFGGLYGDGRYPGNTVSPPHTYNTLR